MKNKILSLFFICVLTSCSLGFKEHSLNDQFLSSGTIIVSQQISEEIRQQMAEMSLSSNIENEQIFAPLIGYFPPMASYLPAENESWIEIFRNTRKILIKKGQTIVQELQGEGEISLAPGEYYIQHKQKNPLWYAPDEYFTKRKLEVPTQGDRSRYRRGALGQFAIYPTTTFALHCAPVWSEDVGGLRINSSEFSSAYYSLPVGSPVIVH